MRKKKPKMADEKKGEEAGKAPSPARPVGNGGGAVRRANRSTAWPIAHTAATVAGSCTSACRQHTTLRSAQGVIVWKWGVCDMGMGDSGGSPRRKPPSPPPPLPLQIPRPPYTIAQFSSP